MKIRFLFGGGKYDEEVRSLAESFVDRVSHYANCEVSLSQSKAKNEPDIREEESSLMLRQIHPSDLVVVFDERGKIVSSEEYAILIDRTKQSGTSSMAVIVGGAHGVSEEVRARANVTLAFGKMIFPHQLARVMALEQTYRALSILEGSKYHHA